MDISTRDRAIYKAMEKDTSLKKADIYKEIYGDKNR
jgi:hypothetical protein